MTQQIKDLEYNKINLLKMNEKYVAVLNQYYRDLNTNYASSENALSETNSHNKSNSKLKSKSKKYHLLLFSVKKKPVIKNPPNNCAPKLSSLNLKKITETCLAMSSSWKIKSSITLFTQELRRINGKIQSNESRASGCQSHFSQGTDC